MNMNVTLNSLMVNKTITCVTHNGVMHTDDLVSFSLISLLAKALDPENKVFLVRTRDESKVPTEGHIVFDVFNGVYDHHNNDEPVDGRKLAAIGLLWRAFKYDICTVFKLDDRAWENIDATFIKPIDHTDNTGEMNPLSYGINGLISANNPTNDETFIDIALGYIIPMFQAIIAREAKGTADRRILASLPVKEIKGKKFAFKEEMGYLQTDANQQDLDGIICHMTDDPVQGIWMVKMFNGGSLSKCGLRNEGNVVFTHPNGFMGKMNTLNALYDCI